MLRSLNNAVSDYGGAHRGDKFGSRVVGDNSIRFNDDNSLDEGLRQSGREGIETGEGRINAFEGLETPRKAISLTTLIQTKTRVSQLVSMLHAKREDMGVIDKARLITVLRMYKVEKEKNKALQNSVSELEEQIINEKQNQTKLQEHVNEIKEHIKMLEQLKAKCPHNRCPVCRGEKDVAETDNPSGKQSLESSTDFMNEEKSDQGELQQVSEEEDDGQEGDEVNDTIGDGENEEGKDKEPGLMKKPSRGNKSKKRLTAVGLVDQKKKGKEQTISAAYAIIEKIKDKKLAKFRNFMPMKSVLKQIHSLYSERIVHTKENSTWREEEFCVFAYKVFSSNFGFRKIAEQKFIIFLLSVKKYLHIVRINLFARFMGLLQGPSNFTVDEFNKYLEGVEFINNSTLGINMVNIETDSKFYAPFLRGLEYLRYFSENKMGMEEYVEFKREFEPIKENDPKNINRNGIVDVDLFMTKVLTKYRIIMSRTKQFVVNAFKAADLDGNKYCSLKEFIMIYRNIETDKFDEGFAENLFYEHADIKVEGEINLSFDKFTVVCVEYGLFSDTQQDAFLEVQSNSDIETRIIGLRVSWKDHYKNIDTKLSETAKVCVEEKDYWLSILNILNERISNFDQIEPVDYKPLLIAFKILDQEVERLRDNEVERDAYGVKKLSAVPKVGVPSGGEIQDENEGADNNDN